MTMECMECLGLNWDPRGTVMFGGKLLLKKNDNITKIAMIQLLDNIDH